MGIDYLFRFQGVMLDIDAVYRFLDKLNSKLQAQVEQIAFAHTKMVLQGNISVVFHDTTMLYFEASNEDDLRKTGFSKDGNHQNPQIFSGCCNAENRRRLRLSGDQSRNWNNPLKLSS